MKKPFFVLIAALFFLGASCTGSARLESGIYRTEDFGKTWEPINRVAAEFNQTILARSSITDFAIDPQNSSTLYASTRSQGLFKSESMGDQWQPITTSGQIQAFSVHPQDNKKIIAARQHQLFLTTDGGEVWQLVYTNPTGSFLTDVIFDSFDKNTIYAAVQTGELLRTTDGGKSWTALHTFEDVILQVHLSAKASQRFYVVLPKDGIFRSDDKGLTWQEVSDSIQRPIDQFTNPLRFQHLIVHANNASDLLLQTSQGIFHSANAGEQWSEIPLLTDNDKRQIRSIAWDPRNRDNIYYATPTVFYQSENFGSSWTTIAFASGSPPGMIIPDPFASGRLYLGTRAQ